MKKTYHHSKEKKKLWLSTGVIFTIIFLISISYRIRSYLSTKQTASSAKQNSQQSLEISEQRPSIPQKIKINQLVDIEVEALLTQGENLPVSDTKATFSLDSSRPGEEGNIIIYGHNTKGIFGNIRSLKGGEKIMVVTEDGSEHIYFVKSSGEYSLDQIDPLFPTTQETLTLYTCAGFLDSKRYVVQAVPQKPEPILLNNYISLVAPPYIETKQEKSLLTPLIETINQQQSHSKDLSF